MSVPQPAGSGPDGRGQAGECVGGMLGRLALLLAFAGVGLCLSVIGVAAGVVALGGALLLAVAAALARHGGRLVAVLIPLCRQDRMPAHSRSVLAPIHRT